MIKDKASFIIADLGNSLWKAIRVDIVGRGDSIKFKRRECVMPAAIHAVNGLARFEGVRQRYRGAGDNGDPERFAVDGVAYTVGIPAEAEGVLSRRTGAAKYTRDYYGIALMAMLLYLYPEGHDNLHMYATFPPSDVSAVDTLIDAVIGKWKVETSGDNVLRYRIRSVQPCDEPIGGYLNATVDPNGTRYKDSAFESGSTLVVDIGGKISSILRVLAGGRPQYGAAASSTDLGIQDVELEFANNLKQQHPELRALRSFDEGIIREALATGRYQFKGHYIDCADQVYRASSSVLNQLTAFYVDRYQAGANDYQILVTGGGGAALLPLLKEALQHDRIFTAERSEAMHLANVRGVEKLAKGHILAGEFNKYLS